MNGDDRAVRKLPQPFRDAAATWWLTCTAGPWLAVGQLACTLVGGLLPAGVAWLTKLLVDGLAGGRPWSALFGAAAGLAAAGLAMGVLPHVSGYLRSELGRRVDRVIQDRLYTAVCSFRGLSRFEDPGFRDRLQMATLATGGALEPATTGLFMVGGSVVTLVSLLATLLVLSPAMAGVLVIAAIPSLAAQISLTRRWARMMLDITPANRRHIFYAGLITDVQAAKEIRLLGLGTFLRRRLLTELTTVHEGQRQVDFRELRTQSLLSVLGAVVAGLGIVWAVRGAAAGQLSVGDLSAFIAVVAGAQQAQVSLVAAIAGAHQALLMFGHFRYVTGLPDDLPSALPPVGEVRAAPYPLRGGIELRDVWFRYDEAHPWVLRGVDLTIPHGRSVALVGLNGAGKSTIVKLLCRFYDPTRGAVLWDGVDIRDLDPAELRRRIGVLFQDFMSYDLTAAENIGLGELDALTDRARIERAARRAMIHTTVAALPRAYDTLLSRIFVTEQDKEDPSTGVAFSGGQWQRLALARTLMRDNRDLLILDEPSAGLDAQAEHEVHTRLRRHREGRTSLLISHRLGAVRDADQIAVLADGRVVEEGSHDELVAVDGVYARLFAVQARGYRRSATTASP